MLIFKMTKKIGYSFTVLALFNSLTNIDDMFGYKGTQFICE